MGKKTAQSSLYPLWTEARVNAFFRSGFRTMSRKWPPMFDALKVNRRRSADGKRFENQCYVCKEWFAQKLIQVDHIEPCGSLKGIDDAELLAQFLRKLFCSVEGLGTVCRPCHAIKTAEERKTK